MKLTVSKFVFAAGALMLIVAATVIVSNSLPHASAEGRKCTAPEAHLPNFDAVNPPEKAPETVFYDGTGKEKTFAGYKGQGLVVNFWATWCAPCVREMPQLDRLKALVAGNNVDVLAISEDRGGATVVKKFYKTNKLHDLDVLIDKAGRLLRASKVKGLPTTILIDRNGFLIGRVPGIAEWDSPEIVDFVRQCLGS